MTPRWTCTTNSTPAAHHEARGYRDRGLPVQRRDREQGAARAGVQANTLNRLRADTILAIITSTYAGRVTELLIDIAQEPGSGLRFNSSVQCDTLATIDQSLVLRTLGAISAGALKKVDDCLKAALGLP